MTPDQDRKGSSVRAGEGRDPYLIKGPALISFSGGRTSAYMLKQIIDAHGGTLPDDVHVCFANTGKEREETLRFVHDCATAWGVRVRWLEWKSRPMGKEGRATPPAERFEEVGYNSASRNGEPFAAVIQRRQFLPNAVTRFCTSALKIDTMKMFMRAQGYDRWLNAVGLRADEMRRVTKQTLRNEAGNERWTTVMPLAKAGVRKEDVLTFWRAQPFDLQLQPHEGNCDLCFLKSKAALLRMISENPSLADWWARQESLVAPKKATGARFVTEYSYRDLADEAHDTLRLPLGDDDYDVECGIGGVDTSIRCGSLAA